MMPNDNQHPVATLDKPPTHEGSLNLPELKERAYAKLNELVSANGEYIWASDSPNFKYAFFGRDTCTVVENLAHNLEHHEKYIKWLVSIARCQGVKDDPMTEEKNGAILHEKRALIMDGEPVDDSAKKLFTELQKVWHSDTAIKPTGDQQTETEDSTENQTLIYYGTLDGPARFIKACVALALNGVILSEHSFTHINGETRTLLDACNYAIGYINDRRAESDLGLIELQPPQNPKTLTNQTTKDSLPAYLHIINGEHVIPNLSAPRAPLEAQLISYEALVKYAEFIKGSNPEKADVLFKNAADLKEKVLKTFLVYIDDPELNKQPYLAPMVDRDPKTGDLRQLNTVMSDAAEGMNGEFFNDDNTSNSELRKSLTRILMSDRFLSDGGVRCRDIKLDGLLDFAEYHGSLTNWVVVTHAAAKGQLKQGYPRIALELWTRMLSAISLTNNFQEFFYFDTEGHLLLPETESTGKATRILPAEEHPQTNQAWSISAVIEAIELMTKQDLENSPSPDKDFEDEILQSITQYRHNPAELIEKIRSGIVIYQLEYVQKESGAHEAMLS